MERKIILILTIITLWLSGFLNISNIYSQSTNETAYVYSSTVVYINRENNDIILDKGYRTFNIFMNTSWQTVYLLSTSHTYKTTKDAEGNPIIILGSSSVPHGGNITLKLSLRIVPIQRKPPYLNFSASGNISDIPKELQQECTTGTGTWLIDNQTLRELAFQIREKKTNVLEIVTSLSNWIGNNIVDYSSDIPRYPTETYDSKKGDCDDKANLLITFCRILGIPAYLQVGSLKTSSQNKETYWDGHVLYSTKYISYHGWAIIYIPTWGWLPFDMTLGWKRSDSLGVVTSAPIWNYETFQIMNITKSDWAGEGRAEKEATIKNQLYFQYEDTLIKEEAIEPWYTAEWLLLSTTATTAILIIVIIRVYIKKH